MDDLQKREAALITIIGLTGTDMYLVSQINDAMDDIIAQEKAIDALNEKYYELDHERLEEVVWEDWTEEAEGLYGQLSGSGALSFARSLSYEMFEAQNPGYRAAPGGSYIDFAQAYKDRIEDWQRYLHGVFEVNNDAAAGIRDSQETIRDLKEASLNAVGYR
jgi:hypothetical protein